TGVQGDRSQWKQWISHSRWRSHKSQRKNDAFYNAKRKNNRIWQRKPNYSQKQFRRKKTERETQEIHLIKCFFTYFHFFLYFLNP
ncbi:hypothetical protein, partial [Comamonas aquatica]|uniref:hypothetical protein n=1 Tax=Comamonas aquatica TaxID=225991 RepID=UPI001C3F25F1